jgi:putative salt-induced outer membrane protein
VTALPHLAALCLPLALAAAPAHAAQEPADPQQPGPLLVNPLLVDPVVAGPLPTVLVPPDPPLPDPVRAMIDAAFASGDNDDVEAVVKFARRTHPSNIGEIDALLAYYRSGHPPDAPFDPVRDMLAAAMASGKDADVEAVAKLAKATTPEDAAEIEEQVVAYRAERQRLKDEAAAAARAKLAAAKFWEHWKGEGQIGASQSSGNTSSAGISAGLAIARKGIDWTHKLRAQADYQRTNGKTSVERYLAELEPQYRIDERTFAFGLGRWEHDRILGYDTRWNLSGGLGYKVVDTKKMTLSLKGGPAFRQTAFVDGGNDTELTALAGLDFGWQLSPTLRLTQVASTIVGTTNSSTSSQTALNAKLTGALSARIAYSAQIDTSPPPGIESVDTQTRFTLVYGF